MNYRWIVIENSLKDKSILKRYKILSETIFGKVTPRQSRMLKIQVPEGEIDNLVHILSENIIYPYYTHIYHEDPKNNRLIVVFSDKIINAKKDNFQEAVDYGIHYGVRQNELDISPCNISQEEW